MRGVAWRVLWLAGSDVGSFLVFVVWLSLLGSLGASAHLACKSLVFFSLFQPPYQPLGWSYRYIYNIIYVYIYIYVYQCILLFSG